MKFIFIKPDHLVLVILFATTLYLLIYGNGKPGRNSPKEIQDCIDKDLFKSSLYDIQRRLIRLENENQTNIEEIESMHLSVASMMASLYKDGGDSGVDYINPNIVGAGSSTLDVCPEEYKGTKYGYPWYNTGFVTLPCTNVKPFKNIITAVFNFRNYPPKYQTTIMEIITSFAEIHPSVSILMAVTEDSPLWDNNKMPARLKVVATSATSSSSSVWNLLISQVKTPYTFVARDISAFDSDCRLERLVRAVSTLGVEIAGGATKSAEGYWNRACYQSVFRNYTLIYDSGYYKSKQDCMWCSLVTGPFVSKTDLIQVHTFDNTLGDDVLFEDFFLRLHLKETKMSVCPDSMFNVFQEDKQTYTKPQWWPLAKKWKINHLRFADSDMISYTCVEVDLGCPKETGLVIPPCCLQVLADQMTFIMKLCEVHGIICEICDGTLLGAVKFDKVLPWERDSDMIFVSSNYSVMKNLKGEFENAGYILIDTDGSFDLRIKETPYWRAELWAYNYVDSSILLKNGRFPTKVKFHGMWVNGPRNPGLYMRNRYGPEIYKHAQHWMTLGLRNSWEPYDAGHFTNCPIPGSHNCLDLFKADGSFQFQVPRP